MQPAQQQRVEAVDYMVLEEDPAATQPPPPAEPAPQPEDAPPPPEPAPGSGVEKPPSTQPTDRAAAVSALYNAARPENSNTPSDSGRQNPLPVGLASEVPELVAELQSVMVRSVAQSLLSF